MQTPTTMATKWLRGRETIRTGHHASPNGP
jgi:hypothetical protein